MLTKVALLTAIPLTALTLVAGCGSDAEPEAGQTPAVAGSGPAASTAPAGDDGTATGGAEGEPADEDTGDPQAGVEDGADLAAIGDAGDWDAMVADCANDDQEAVVQQVVNADVTGDGKPDALVARTCDASTSYYPSTVEIFDGSSPSARPWRVGTLLSDVGPTDQPWLTGLKVSGGVVTVTANGVDAKGSNACPNLKLTYRYKLSGTQFKRLDRQATTSTECLPVG
ncbi:MULTISPECIES: hypothetical protein [Actinoplanes]|uniref:hypothetical protein n=1 Tax=Actinoplanes TaxID=1865 RepID=UPI0005F2F58A|nr:MULTISPECIES: hypothetical protein [Actinoplanes]GLX99692.1 hypothetical protein Acsp01_00720 [Actinoplanes sp. NBRC 101535]